LQKLPIRHTIWYTRWVTTTTIKVPTELRDRISASARSRGTTAAGLLTELLDEHERAKRFSAVKSAYARLSPDDDYWAETRAWEALEAQWPSDDE
jgi:predicted DNA-binding protein